MNRFPDLDVNQIIEKVYIPGITDTPKKHHPKISSKEVIFKTLALLVFIMVILLGVMILVPRNDIAQKLRAVFKTDLTANNELKSEAVENSPIAQMANNNFCSCDGIEVSEIIPGKEVNISVFGKVTDRNIEKAMISQMTLYLGETKNASNSAMILKKFEPSNAVIIEGGVQKVRYKSVFKFLFPEVINKTSTYQFWAQNNCQTKTTQVAKSVVKPIILESPSNIKPTTTKPAKILTNACNLVQFKFER